MADYQRFVSYLYEYKKNTKSRNCGFCRVELREHTCHLEIHLKLQNNPFTPTLKVFVFVPIREKLYGIFLGNASSQQGNISGTFSFSDRNIKGSTYQFSDLGGILIQNDTGQCFGSAWKDITILPENFTIFENASAKNTSYENNNTKNIFSPNTSFSKEASLPNSTTETAEVESKSEPCEPHVETTPAISHETESISESATENELSPKQELSQEFEIPVQSETQEKLTISAEPNHQEKLVLSAEPESQEKLAISTASESQEKLEIPTEPESPEPSLLAASTDSAQVTPTPERENFWETILKSYPQCHPFFDDEIHNCVQLSPRDVQKIAASGFPINNNAFFRHNCQSFQHFLLGKKNCNEPNICHAQSTDDTPITYTNNRKTQYILAVPGLYNPKEQYMASMFGFPYFKSGQNSRMRNNTWGYWYRIIPEHYNDCPF